MLGLYIHLFYSLMYFVSFCGFFFFFSKFLIKKEKQETVGKFRVRSFDMIRIKISVIRDHWDHCTSKEPVNPSSDWIHRIL